MGSLNGTQTDYKAKLGELKAEWDQAKKRHRKAERAVEDAIQRGLELRQELERRGQSF